MDGINPFGNPLANAGLYDPCDKSLQASRTIGTLTRDAEIALLIPNIGTWAKNPFLYEIGSTTVPADVYDAMYGLNAIEKGSYLTSTYGLGGTLGLNLEAIGTGELSTTIWTGGTPGARLLLLGAGQAADSYFFK